MKEVRSHPKMKLKGESRLLQPDISIYGSILTMQIQTSQKSLFLINNKNKKKKSNGNYYLTCRLPRQVKRAEGHLVPSHATWEKSQKSRIEVNLKKIRPGFDADLYGKYTWYVGGRSPFLVPILPATDDSSPKSGEGGYNWKSRRWEARTGDQVSGYILLKLRTGTQTVTNSLLFFLFFRGDQVRGGRKLDWKQTSSFLGTNGFSELNCSSIDFCSDYLDLKLPKKKMAPQTPESRETGSLFDRPPQH